MNRDETIFIISIIIFIAPIAIFVPSFLAESTTDTAEKTFMLEENDTIRITSDLEMTVDTVASNFVTVQMLDTETAEFEEQGLEEEGGTTWPHIRTYEFEKGDIVVTLTGISVDTYAGFVVEYPTTYGFSSQEIRLHEILPFIVILPLFAILTYMFLQIIFKGES